MSWGITSLWIFRHLFNRLDNRDVLHPLFQIYFPIWKSDAALSGKWNFPSTTDVSCETIGWGSNTLGGNAEMPGGLICHALLTQRSHIHRGAETDYVCVFSNSCGVFALTLWGPHQTGPAALLSDHCVSGERERTEANLRHKLLVRVNVRLCKWKIKAHQWVCVLLLPP